MENNSLISIIIPCYNQAHFLNETLESVHNQTYSDWECIIVNDGSSDNTQDIAINWTIKDDRFRYFYKENSGVSNARNYGIRKATGKFLQFLDSDDLLHESKLELSLKEFIKLKNSNVKIVITNFSMFKLNPNLILEPYCNLKLEFFNFESLLYKWNELFTIPLHCGIFESSLFESIEFPPDLSAQEDWVVWINLFKITSKVVFIDKPLALYRINPFSRMSTVGIDDNQIKAYEHFKLVLTKEQYDAFTVHLITKYYRSDKDFKLRLDQTKKSNTYQTGLMIKKILVKMGLLDYAKCLFPLFLKMKK